MCRTRERLALNIRSSSTPILTQGRLIFTSGLFWATSISTGPAKTLRRSTTQTRHVFVANSSRTGPDGLMGWGHNAFTASAQNAAGASTPREKHAKYLMGGPENLLRFSVGLPSALHWWWIAISIGRTKRRQANAS